MSKISPGSNLYPFSAPILKLSLSGFQSAKNIVCIVGSFTWDETLFPPLLLLKGPSLLLTFGSRLLFAVHLWDAHLVGCGSLLNFLCTGHKGR
jgi:hypothetical protein